MSKVKILWADDEIDLLKPQLFFLEKKGYEVATVTNGHDALDLLEQDKDVEVVFLDESMPGISGLETLSHIKSKYVNLPVVLITKNEAENLMEEAIGSQIDDYLIKPVNPNQILLTLKKIIDNKRLVSEKTASDYQQAFRELSLEMGSGLDRESWVDFYKKLIDWELRLDSSETVHMGDILSMQKSESNKEFSRFIDKHYQDWINEEDGPVMSHSLLKEKMFPKMAEDKPNVLLLLDNLRFDQWKILEPIILEKFKITSEEHFYSILPTSTQYSRNAIFAGMLPADIQKHYPDKWVYDHENEGKNKQEEFFMQAQLDRIVKRKMKMKYHKILNTHHAKTLNDNILNALNNDLTVIVYNFIDTLSHARTEMEVLKELAGDEKAYRSLTKSWFLNSPLWAALQTLAENDIKLFITTDHGTIRVNNPSKVIADRDTTTNLRYKVGKNLRYQKNDVYEAVEPKKIGLPSPNISSTYIFGKEDTFFLYPNNYGKYHNMYKNTFQHGGISLEEVICPFVCLEPR